MRTSGLTLEETDHLLSSAKNRDLGYHQVLSSMCTMPHPVAVKAHMMFLESNLGDPGLFRGSYELETLLVQRLAGLMHGPGAEGYGTSGGTESNLQAMRVARERKKLKCPNIVVPASAHFSFEKACRILSLEIRTVPSDGTFCMNPDLVEDQIDKNTIALVGVAGSTEYGTVDPIAYLSDVAGDRDLFLHVDAAFGGLVLPFLPNPPAFDFALPGVDSISVDPHKMGMSTIPCGCFLLRDADNFRHLGVDTPYLTVKREYTLAGTRSGAAVVAAAAVLEHLGTDGMRSIVTTCMDNTHYLIEKMASLGFPVIVTPDVNVAAFDCPLRPEGWVVSTTRNGHMRIVCMPHVTRPVLDAFIAALEVQAHV